jgi:uncharacterized protein with GYD domain
MPYYLIQTAVTPESWAKMIKSPQDRVELIRPAIEGLGGRIDTAYITFGEYDFATIAEFPDSATAAAFSIAISAGGGVRSYKTTPLLTMSDAQDAMKKASAVTYDPAK